VVVVVVVVMDNHFEKLRFKESCHLYSSILLHVPFIFLSRIRTNVPINCKTTK